MFPSELSLAAAFTPPSTDVVILYLVLSQRVNQMSGLAGEITETSEQQGLSKHRVQTTHVTCSKPKPPESPPDCLLSVVSRHGQVEACLTDVSLHPMNRLAGGGAEQTGIKQFDDI